MLAILIMLGISILYWGFIFALFCINGLFGIIALIISLGIFWHELDKMEEEK